MRYTRRSSGNFAISFAWLGLAFFIDGIDGTLARAAKVQITAATIDGTVLDLVIDFLTYVLVPVVALWRSDLMPTEASFWIGLIVTIASALYFADTRMKTDDLWFRGFPATWNIVVLYLFVLRPPWVVSALILLGATALMFTPVVFIHPLRVVRLRNLTIAMTCAWFALAAIAIAEKLAPQAWVGWGLIVTAALFPRAAAPASFAAGGALSTGARIAGSALRAGLNPWYSRASRCCLASSSASWRSGYAEDCKSLHPGSIPGEASKELSSGAAIRPISRV